MIAVGGIGIAALALLFIVRLAHLDQTIESIDRDSRQQDAARVMQVDFKKQVQEWKDILLRGHDAADLQRYRAAFLDRSSAVRATGQQLQRSIADESARALVAQFLDAHAAAGKKYEAAFAQFAASGGVDARTADRAVRGQDRAPTDLIDTLVRQLNQGGRERALMQIAALRREQITTAAAAVLLLAALMAGSVFVARSISQPIAETVVGLERVAAGDLGHRLTIVGDDEVSRMNHALNVTVDAIERTNQRLRDAVTASEAATRAKSEFLANMSHEIRTPMNGVIGMTELLLDTELSKDQRESLEIVRASAESLLAILNDILDFSKVEAGKLELEHVPLVVGDLVTEALKPLAQTAGQKGLELIPEVAADVPVGVLGDPVRLRQVLSNLVSNAIKFTEKGHVWVHVSVETRKGNRVVLVFAVTDTGIGIAEDKLRAIFDAFVQADGSTTRRFGGTGLGLSICAKLVGLMGGQIWAESQISVGSTFRFTVECEVSEAGLLLARPDPILAGHRALIVDDNAVNRRIFHEQLTRWEMRPLVVESGWAALHALVEAAQTGDLFSVVLLDGNMPEFDGFEVAAAMRQLPDVSGVPIVMLTSAERPGDAERCRKLGIAIYLTKPARQRDVFDAVCAALQPATRASNEPTVVRAATISKRVLVAEDNRVNQLVVQRLLTSRGHLVTLAADGHEAVAQFQAAAFDIVLMDVQMPSMGGFEATARIRALEAETGRHTPIIALTAHAMHGDRDRCLTAGMDGHITKPIDRLELFARVETVGPGEPAPALKTD